MKEGKRRAVKLKKGEYEMHSRNVPLAGETKICRTFAHFSNLSLIELRFQTPGRQENTAEEEERETEIHVSEEGLNLTLRQLGCEDDGSHTV